MFDTDVDVDVDADADVDSGGIVERDRVPLAAGQTALYRICVLSPANVSQHIAYGAC